MIEKAKPTPKPAIEKPVTKATTPKAPAKKPTPKPAVKKPIKVAASARPSKAAAPAKPAKPAKAAKPPKAAKTPKPEKSRKIKMVSSRFSLPASEYAQLVAMKKICLKAGVPVKKSELLRAGLLNLAKLSDIELIAAAVHVEQLINE